MKKVQFSSNDVLLKSVDQSPTAASNKGAGNTNRLDNLSLGALKNGSWRFLDFLLIIKENRNINNNTDKRYNFINFQKDRI